MRKNCFVTYLLFPWRDDFSGVCEVCRRQEGPVSEPNFSANGTSFSFPIKAKISFWKASRGVFSAMMRSGCVTHILKRSKTRPRRRARRWGFSDRRDAPARSMLPLPTLLPPLRAPVIGRPPDTRMKAEDARASSSSPAASSRFDIADVDTRADRHQT